MKADIASGPVDSLAGSVDPPVECLVRYWSVQFGKDLVDSNPSHHQENPQPLALNRGSHPVAASMVRMHT